MTGWVVFAVVWITRRFEASLVAKDRALDRLRVEEQQRLDAERRHHQAAMELIEAQKREVLGRLANGVAHDFNNSLLVILGWNEMLKSGALPEDKRRLGHAAIASAADGAAQLARHLLTIGRRQAEHRKPTRLGPLVEEAARHLRHLLPDDIRIETRIESAPPVVIDRSQMHQVLLNLALNARDAMPRGGTLEFSLHSVRGEDAGLPAGRGWVELIVRDDGTGMDEATLARLFEPYFTTKPEGHGTGIGLATTQAIVKAAGGQIRIHSAPGQGSRVTIQLPVSEAAVSDDDADGVTTDPKVLPGTRVAVVEDDEGARKFIAMALRTAGYDVLEARDGDAALELLRDIEPVDALCVDAIVPGAPVERVIEAFRRRVPGGPVLVCSGNVGSDRVRELIEHGELPLLAKPFTGTQLVAKLAELIGSGRSVRDRA
jgi:signal transduction histidine kinase/ActR/RegA family two-component response regulator